MEMRRIQDERCLSRGKRVTSVATVFAWKWTQMCGFQEPGPNFFAIAPTRWNYSSISQRKWCNGRIREDITTATYNGTTVGHGIPVVEMRTVCSQQEADAERSSHHTCSELRILERSAQDIWLWCDRRSHSPSSMFRDNRSRVQDHGKLRHREDTASPQMI